MIALLMLLQATTPPQAMPAFLSGCWEQRSKDDRWTEECWTSARGGLMIGSGRDGKGDEVRHWEWMRIERGADGSLTFYGSPKGAAAVGFQLIEADATSTWPKISPPSRSGVTRCTVAPVTLSPWVRQA